MYVLSWYSARVRINRVRLPILIMVSRTGKEKIVPVPVRACKFDLARRVLQSRPTSACSSPYILRLNLMNTYYGIPPKFRGGSIPSLFVHLPMVKYIPCCVVWVMDDAR